MGGKTAAKLLARYHDLEAVLAAADAGQLKGWGPAVQHLLEGRGSSSNGGGGSGGSGGSTGGDWRARLRRNRQLFAASADPAVVDARGMRLLQERLERQQPAAAAQPWDSSGAAGSGSSSSRSIEPTAGLAWLHPLHARRWRCLQQLSQAALQGGRRSSWRPQQAATPHGLAVDGLEAGAAGSGGAATFFVCPADMQAGAWPKAVSASRQRPQDGNAAESRALAPLLHGGMRHHVKLVQRAGYRVELRLPPVEPGLLAAAAGEPVQSSR